ncbi:MAG: excinuclease ABC subunit C [Nanoarchaeota archaeon]|nr:excinuclease ABC subunit C [Nanoarchaeota archaeon]
MVNKIKLKEVPENPGCYLYKDSRGKIIYIGKAKNLKKRVASYFTKGDHTPKTLQLLKNLVSVDFFITDNEVEALILENNLIKKFKPKYNISLRDSKRYAYIQITGEEYPRIMLARKREGEGRFYGPFVSGASRDYLMDALIKIFGIRTCNKMPKRECLRYSLGICTAPCTAKISKTEYLERVRSAELVLKGKTKKLVKTLFIKMKENAAVQNYEKSLEIKNQIEATKYLREKQKMERKRDYDEDIINFIVQKDKVDLLLFNSRKGILENKQEFEFNLNDNFLEEFLIQYYSDNEIPRKVIVPSKVDENIEKYLEKIKGSKVEVIVPKAGISKELLELVLKNLEIMLFGDQDKIEDLMNKLKLNELPRVIECFDVSHLSGTSTVASMVQFRNGKADKSNYRKYKLRTVAGIDDFLSMKEVIRRRYTKLMREKLAMPNLVVVDGGKGQLSSTIEVLEELNLKLVVISLAKREEEVFIPGRSAPVILDKRGKALKLLIQIRDEAHRFAISYNRLLRKKKLFE